MMPPLLRGARRDILDIEADMVGDGGIDVAWPPDAREAAMPKMLPQCVRH